MFKPQHASHVNAFINYVLLQIATALNVNNIEGVSAWYACGDELI